VPQESKALVRRFFEEVCNARKLDVADELFAANHTYHDPFIPAGPGPAGMKQVIASYHSAFSDAHWEVEEMVDAEGDLIVTRWIGSGTQDGELVGIPATNRRVEVLGIWMHSLAEGKIGQSWNVWDTLGMLRQLGIVSLPG
jgi:steroid delta-isomerase-like uncharacterized protein